MNRTFLRSRISGLHGLALSVFLLGGAALPAHAQIPPSADERERYSGLHAAAAGGDVSAIATLVGAGADVEARDEYGRTALHVAAFLSHDQAVRALVAGGADPRALEHQKYDIVTIAAVNDDVDLLKVALELGGDARAITSPYVGTALIAAAHLGHDEVVKTLISAGAPLDHVNNLGWTALIESIVLGDGGPRHIECLNALLDAGADPNLADRAGVRPLALARARGFEAMARRLEAAGGH